MTSVLVRRERRSPRQRCLSVEPSLERSWNDHFVWAFSLMFLFSGRGYWQELIESIAWATGFMHAARFLGQRILSRIIRMIPKASRAAHPRSRLTFRCILQSSGMVPVYQRCILQSDTSHPGYPSAVSTSTCITHSCISHMYV